MRIKTIFVVCLLFSFCNQVFAQEKIWPNSDNIYRLGLSRFSPIPLVQAGFFFPLSKAASENGIYQFAEKGGTLSLLQFDTIGKGLEESVAYNGLRIFITANDFGKTQLWKNNNGQITEIASLTSPAGFDSFLGGLRVVNNEVFFIHSYYVDEDYNYLSNLYKTNGDSVELIASNLTATGWEAPGYYFGGYAFDVRNNTVFFGSGTSLKKYQNGTISEIKDLGTTRFGIRVLENRLIAQREISGIMDLIAINENNGEITTLDNNQLFIRSSDGLKSKLFYSYADSITNDLALAVTDGTVAGTKVITNLIQDQDPALKISIGTLLPFKNGAIVLVSYLNSEDSVVKSATFFIDGNTAVKLIDKAGLTADSRISFASDSEYAYIPACDSNACAIYKTNGTQAKTSQISVLYSNSECSSNQPQSLTVSNNNLYYFVRDGLACVDNQYGGKDPASPLALFKYVINPKAPDLIISALGSSNKTVKRNSFITLSMLVKNVGKSKTKRSFNSQWYLSKDKTLGTDDITFGQKTIKSISPKESVEISLRRKVPARWQSGKYWLIAKTDSDSVVTELDENNNIRSGSSQIKIIK